MTENRWVTLLEVNDRLQAEILKNALESQNIPVDLIQEGISHYLYPVGGPIGTIQVCVPENRMAEAKLWLDDYNRGNLEENGGGSDPDLPAG